MPHMLCITNMMLNDINTPNVIHDNGLIRNVREFSSDEKVYENPEEVLEIYNNTLKEIAEIKEILKNELEACLKG